MHLLIQYLCSHPFLGRTSLVLLKSTNYSQVDRNLSQLHRIHIYIYVYYICTYIHIYIHIYRERVHVYIKLCIYIIYAHIYTIYTYPSPDFSMFRRRNCNWRRRSHPFNVRSMPPRWLDRRCGRPAHIFGAPFDGVIFMGSRPGKLT